MVSLGRCPGGVDFVGIGPGPGRTPARPLARDDRSLVEDLAAPDAAWFGAFERAGQAGRAQRAGPAMRLGLLKLGGQLGEPQIAGYAVAGQRLSQRRSVALADMDLVHGGSLLRRGCQRRSGPCALRAPMGGYGRSAGVSARPSVAPGTLIVRPRGCQDVRQLADMRGASRAGLRGTIPGRRRPASLSPARERPGRRAGRGRRYPAWRTRASGGSGRFAGR